MSAGTDSWRVDPAAERAEGRGSSGAPKDPTGPVTRGEAHSRVTTDRANRRLTEFMGPQRVGCPPRLAGTRTAHRLFWLGQS